MSKLGDPSLPPGAIVEEYDDGGALRNDGVRLTAANKNPWYVLATIWGEQPEGAELFYHDQELAKKNREAWKSWVSGKVSAKIRDEFFARMGEGAKLPARSEKQDFSNLYISKLFIVEGFDFWGPSFNNTVFHKGCSFSHANFRGDTAFEKADFCNETSFFHASFRRKVKFCGATFCHKTFFRGVKFGDSVRFDGARFECVAEFDAAEFEYATVFLNSCFRTHVPTFYRAIIYENTSLPLTTANWPRLSGEGVMPAEDQKRAYSRLRLFFAKTQQIDEEQFFHRQEMRCKQEMARGATRWLYSLYGLLSDYGISIWRPLAALGVLAVLGAALLSYHTGVTGTAPQGSTFWRGMGWSLSNLLPFTGFGRIYFGPDFYRDLPTWLKAFAGAQTLLALPLLFLLGLGLRNTFRLR